MSIGGFAPVVIYLLPFEVNFGFISSALFLRYK
jgi:hypothetical protein